MKWFAWCRPSLVNFTCLQPMVWWELQSPEFTVCGKGNEAQEQLFSALFFSMTTKEGAVLWPQEFCFLFRDAVSVWLEKTHGSPLWMVKHFIVYVIFIIYNQHRIHVVSRETMYLVNCVEFARWRPYFLTELLVKQVLWWRACPQGGSAWVRLILEGCLPDFVGHRSPLCLLVSVCKGEFLPLVTLTHSYFSTTNLIKYISAGLSQWEPRFKGTRVSSET